VTEPDRAAKGPKPKDTRRRVSGKRALALMLLVGALVIGVVVVITAGGMPSFHAPRVLGSNRKW
jgi:hypothetical protein